jgi:hypothetical protein
MSNTCKFERKERSAHKDNRHGTAELFKPKTNCSSN